MHNRQLFLRHVAQTSDAPLLLEITHADGCWLYDTAGKKYLDLISGIAVSNTGHGHPAVKAAIHEQAEKYLHLMVYGEFVQSPQVQYARWLTDRLPASLDSVYFVNSGSEATEGAIKLAKRVTGRTEIVSFRNAYHGSTMGALSAGNTEERKNPFRPLIPDNRVLDYLHTDQLQQITEHTAAALVEPIQSEAGVIIPDDRYLKALRDRCTETGTLLMFDECQTAFGRTGSLFRFQATGVIPDVLLLGKAIGGGLPLGAFIARKEMMHTFTHQPVLGHITTFGGHPLCCAAGLAAAQVLEEDGLIASAEQKGALFSALLSGHPRLGSFRRCGLMMAAELPDMDTNLAMVKKLLDHGILIDWFLFAPNCLRIAPPLTITSEEITHACRFILEELNALK